MAWQKLEQSAVFESPLNSDWHAPPIGSPIGSLMGITAVASLAAGFTLVLAVPALSCTGALATGVPASDVLAKDTPAVETPVDVGVERPSATTNRFRANDTFNGRSKLVTLAATVVPFGALVSRADVLLVGVDDSSVVQPEQTVNSVTTAVVAA